MEKTLEILKSLESRGIFKKYAIGGGIAATYYGEPTMAYDLDLFVFFPTGKDDLNLLTPTYNYLTGLGYSIEGDGILIEGVHVQFLPAYNPLIEEAVEESISVKFGSTNAQIFSLEYLMAIMVQTFRPKDKIRIENLLELIGQPDARLKFDSGKFSDILTRYGLRERWDDFIKGN
ncbi:MAG: hypothetical protein NTY09_06065 [bacterium]|nr:hypothetical protein [bacterium]